MYVCIYKDFSFFFLNSFDAAARDGNSLNEIRNLLGFRRFGNCIHTPPRTQHFLSFELSRLLLVQCVGILSLVPPPHFTTLSRDLLRNIFTATVSEIILLHLILRLLLLLPWGKPKSYSRGESFAWRHVYHTLILMIHLRWSRTKREMNTKNGEGQRVPNSLFVRMLPAFVIVTNIFCFCLFGGFN